MVKETAETEVTSMVKGTILVLTGYATVVTAWCPAVVAVVGLIEVTDACTVVVEVITGGTALETAGDAAIMVLVDPGTSEG